MKSNAFL